jgi:predicted acylesterase/phospholipase RssA
MKGGSVKGLAYVGALKELEKYYNFDWFVGTSAGAIAAVLLAAGYTSSELETILSKKNFRDFLDAAFYRWPTNLYLHKGIFPADSLVNWIDDLLATKLGSGSRVKLKDLPTRVTIYAARKDEDTLIFDSHDPQTMNTYASFAIRCSMAIPFVFMPQNIQGMRVLDGGMRNNYPVAALLRDHPDIKFIGLYLGPRTYEGNARKDRDGSLVGNLLAIWTESSDWKALEKYRDQTIIIDCRPITSLNFKLSDREKEFLIQAGRAAALEYLAAHLPQGREPAIDRSDVEVARSEVEKRRELLTLSRHWWNRLRIRSVSKSHNLM